MAEILWLLMIIGLLGGIITLGLFLVLGVIRAVRWAVTGRW